MPCREKIQSIFSLTNIHNKTSCEHGINSILNRWVFLCSFIKYVVHASELKCSPASQFQMQWDAIEFKKLSYVTF